jgi:predicted acyl esterase
MTAGQEVTGRYQVIVGDWKHGGGRDWGVELQWYDTWIKGIDNGLPTDTRTPLHLQERATGRWINVPRYPLTDVSRALYLTKSGELENTMTGDGEDTLAWASPEEVSNSIEYRSDPFVDGAMIAGAMAASVRVTSSNTNAQLLVELFDVAQDGTRSLITHASVLGSRRRLDPERSWSDENGQLVRPYLTLDQDEPLVPGEPSNLDFPLRPTLWSIETGHHLLLRLSTRPPAENCTYDSGRAPWGCFLTEPMRESLEGGVYRIHYGGASGSLVRLPLIEHGSFDTARSVSSPTVRDDSALPGDW